MCDICHGINKHLCPVCGDQNREEVCPECNGECWLYEAFDIIDRHSFRVSAEEYDDLPDNEDDAHKQNRRLCKGDIQRCPKCDGSGYVYPDEEDSFDELAAEEKYYERKYGRR